MANAYNAKFGFLKKLKKDQKRYNDEWSVATED